VNWTLFATIFAQIEPPLLAMVDGLINVVCGMIGTPLRIGLTVWVAGMMLANALNPEGNPLTNLERNLLRGAVALVFATSVADYNLVFRDTFLANLSTDINHGISGATGGAAIGAAAFDTVWNKAWVAGLVVFKELSWSDFGLQILVAIYFLVALGAIGMGFLIWLFAHLALALLVATGPFFVALFAFPATRIYFGNWIGAMLHSVLTQVFVVALLVLLIGAENTIIAQIAAQPGGNTITQLQLLLGGGLLFAVCGWTVKQIPSASGAIASGAVFHAPSMMAAMGAGVALGSYLSPSKSPPATQAAGASAGTQTASAPPGRSASAAPVTP